MNQQIVNKIIENGIKNLKEFGYTTVTKENILTDMVYSMFFKNMLKENLGMGFDEEINYLINQIQD